jgi:hypothetical protein
MCGTHTVHVVATAATTSLHKPARQGDLSYFVMILLKKNDSQR